MYKVPFVDVVLRSGAGRGRGVVGVVDVRRDERGVHHAPRLSLVQRLERRPLLQQGPEILERKNMQSAVLLPCKIRINLVIARFGDFAFSGTSSSKFGRNIGICCH